jgi:hypothetical protein
MKQKTWGAEDKKGSLDHLYWKENGFLDPKRNYYIDVKVGLFKKTIIVLMKRLFFVIFG